MPQLREEERTACKWKRHPLLCEAATQGVEESLRPSFAHRSEGFAKAGARVGNQEESMLDSRFRGNDSVEVHNLPTRLRLNEKADLPIGEL